MGELLTRSVGSLATSPRAKGIGYTLEVQRRIRERSLFRNRQQPIKNRN